MGQISMRRMQTVVRKHKQTPKQRGMTSSPPRTSNSYEQRCGRPGTRNTPTSAAICPGRWGKMEFVDLRTQWYIQKVSTAPEKLSRYKQVYIQ